MTDPQRPIKTLERVISKAGIGSRREARRWIGAGRVKVNGCLVQTPDHWVDLERDVVTLDGKPVRARRRIYLALYKPKGYITSYADPQGRPTVYDLIAGLGEFVVPVGRLDRDSSGLLLMTNDTAFAELIMNPDHEAPKTYLVKAATLLTEEQLEQLRRGVELDDGPTKSAEVRRIRDSRKRTFLEMTIREGRYREVRRMLEAVGSRALKLVRTAIGPLAIGNLEIGRYRELTPEEVKSLVPRRRGAGSQHTDRRRAP
ncbi:MAG: pseudouridine synthase [Bryobacteraceae bacterium]|jgi:pseudouridine synthase